MKMCGSPGAKTKSKQDNSSTFYVFRMFHRVIVDSHSVAYICFHQLQCLHSSGTKLHMDSRPSNEGGNAFMKT